MMSEVKKVLILDDHQLFLEGMKRVITEMNEDLEMVLATGVSDALIKIDQGNNFSLFVIDLYMPRLDGFAFLKALNQRKIFTPVIVLSSSTDLSDIRRAIQAGALGYLCKDSTAYAMQSAIRSVLQGKLFLPDDVWEQLDAYPTSDSDLNNEVAEQSSKLSQRQSEVYRLIRDGTSNTEIASILNIKETTVKYHIGVMFKRFGVSSRTALLKKLEQ